MITASRDTDHFSSAEGVRPVNMVPLSIVSMDDPEHTRQRRLLSKGFTPRQVRSMTDHVRELTNSVIDEVESSGEIDFVSDLAMHIPLIVISELLGLDPGMRRTLYEWSDAMIGGVDKTAGPDLLGLHHDMRCSREITIETFTDCDGVHRAGFDGRETPYRDHTPVCLTRRKEIPVVHRVPEHGVGHIVRGKRKGIDAE